MHDQARQWVVECVGRLDGSVRSVVELGSADVNGQVRDLFPDVDSYVGVDLEDGAGVDVVADAAVWQPPAPVDLVVSCELLEHTPSGADIVRNAFQMLRDGGFLVLTCAGPDRPKHGARGASRVADGEWYENIHPDVLVEWLESAGFDWFDCDVRRRPSDVRVFAQKRKR